MNTLLARRGVYALVFLTACEQNAAKSSAAVPSSTAAAAAPALEQAWFSRSLQRDLNGDGRGDSAVLVARGDRPDSSDVALTLFVDGRATMTERWSTAYELVDPPDSLRTPALREEFLRNRLAYVLTRLQLGALDVGAIAITEGIAAIQPRLDSIVPLPKKRLNLTYGYESSVAFIWDASRQRFVRFYVCC